MIAYILLFGVIGFIAGRTNHLLVGLAVTLAIVLAMGALYWLALDLIFFGIGYWIGIDSRNGDRRD